MSNEFSVGSRVFFSDKRIGTITHIYQQGLLADIRSCGEFYTCRIDRLEHIPADWKPRWRRADNITLREIK